MDLCALRSSPELPWKWCWCPNGRAAVGNSLRARQALTVNHILNLRPRQIANLPRQQVKMADGGLCPLEQGVAQYYHFHFLLVLQCGSGSPGSDAPRRSSPTLVLNLFHSCKAAGGVRDIFLVPENLQLSPSWENPIQQCNQKVRGPVSGVPPSTERHTRGTYESN